MATNEYQSALFEEVMRVLDASPAPAAVLDLGPTTPVNLSFWTRRGFDLSAFDLAGRARRGGGLELGARVFDAVLCWNALAALSPEEAGMLVAELCSRLRPGGVLFAIFDGDGRAAPPARRYSIVNSARLAFCPTSSSDPVRSVSTHEVEALMSVFRSTRTTVMRHGAREAFGRVPLPPRRLGGPDELGGERGE